MFDGAVPVCASVKSPSYISSGQMRAIVQLGATSQGRAHVRRVNSIILRLEPTPFVDHAHFLFCRTVTVFSAPPFYCWRPGDITARDVEYAGFRWKARLNSPPLSVWIAPILSPARRMLLAIWFSSSAVVPSMVFRNVATLEPAMVVLNDCEIGLVS